MATQTLIAFIVLCVTVVTLVKMIIKYKKEVNRMNEISPTWGDSIDYEDFVEMDTRDIFFFEQPCLMN